MNTALTTVLGRAKSVLNLVKGIGPLAISQSEKLSEAYAEHQMRLAKVEVCKEFMIQEVQTIAEIKKKLLEHYFEGTGEERLRYKRDIEEADRELRKLRIYQKAVEYLPEEGTEHSEVASEQSNSDPSISPHWMDKFNEFARASNEPWREDLLSRALAKEAVEPSSVGPRALWLIGTIDEYLFHAYASILDISTLLNGCIVPNYKEFLKCQLSTCILGPDLTLGHVIFMLSDLGLIGDPVTSHRVIPEGTEVTAHYGHRVVLIKASQKLAINGILPTRLGGTIASLYTPQPSLLGQEIFEKWLSELSQDIYPVANLA